MADRPQEAIPMLQKCLRLSPIPLHSQVLGVLANSYRRLGQYEEAVATYKKMLQRYGPDHLLPTWTLAVTYALMDREKEARAEGAEVLRIDPKFSMERYVKGMPLISQKRSADRALTQGGAEVRNCNKIQIESFINPKLLAGTNVDYWRRPYAFF